MSEKHQCPKCEHSFEDTDIEIGSEVVCPKCAATFTAETKTERIAKDSDKKTPMPNNHILWAILSMILVLPLGIAATINATKVKKRYIIGDYKGAIKASENAKEWCKAALFGFIISIAFVIFMYI